MSSPVLGEFAGTFILIVLGDGVVAGVLLKRSKSENAGWIAITTGWGLAVVAGVFTALAFGSPDAHLNPAVTLGAAVATGDFAKVVPYSAAQMAGAFLGAVVVWLHYLPHWRLTTDRDAKLGVFCNAPAVRHAGANLTSEIIGTFVLVLVATAIFSSRVTVAGLAPGSGRFWLAAWCGGSGCRWAARPATRSTRRATSARGWRTPCCPFPDKRDADWGYASIPVVGPLVGGALAGVVAGVVGF